LWVYRIFQAILSILWFIFSILGAGPFDGWAKFGALSECGLGFSIFLGVIQNLIYMIASGLGIYCIYALGKVYGENPFNEDAKPPQASQEDDNAVGAIQGFGKKVMGKMKGAQREREDDAI
jgi:hypothetical protein